MVLRILHVASFHGNIGDNANHAGFRPWFESIVGEAVIWDDFEIRDVYRKTEAFDLAFAERANRYDLLVVGGGNYFELWDASSPTGTSFSITDEALERLTVPIFFNALGVDAGQGVPDVARERFQAFLRKILGPRDALISVRNDGSRATLQANSGNVELESVLQLPDAGFFAGYGQAASPPVCNGFPTIGINLAGDMLEGRFPGEGRRSYEAFLAEFVHFMAGAVGRWPGARFVLFAHIFRDIRVIADLLDALPDPIRRENCRAAPYDSGRDAAAEIFGAYASCDLILGMRFHANVVPIGMGVPTVGLVSYSQVAYLYEELACPSRAVDVRKPGFAETLLEFTEEAAERGEVVRGEMQRLQRLVLQQREKAEAGLRDWLERQPFKARS